MTSNSEIRRRTSFQQALNSLEYAARRYKDSTGILAVSRKRELLYFLRQLEESTLSDISQQISVFSSNPRVAARARAYIRRAFTVIRKKIRGSRSDLDIIKDIRHTIVKGRSFSLQYYISLVAHMEVGKARTIHTLRDALDTTGLVRISNNPSVNADCYCEEFRGRVFSTNLGDPRFPYLGDTPNGGPPFHAWCYHQLEIIDDSIEDPLIVDSEFLRQPNETPLQYQRRLSKRLTRA